MSKRPSPSKSRTRSKASGRRARRSRHQLSLLGRSVGACEREVAGRRPQAESHVVPGSRVRDHEAAHAVGAQLPLDGAGRGDEAPVAVSPGFGRGEEPVGALSHGRIRAKVLEEKGPPATGGLCASRSKAARSGRVRVSRLRSRTPRATPSTRAVRHGDQAQTVAKAGHRRGRPRSRRSGHPTGEGGTRRSGRERNAPRGPRRERRRAGASSVRRSAGPPETGRLAARVRTRSSRTRIRRPRPTASRPDTSGTIRPPQRPGEGRAGRIAMIGGQVVEGVREPGEAGPADEEPQQHEG